MTAMSIRLGPALKICSAVDAMREQLKQVCKDRASDGPPESDFIRFDLNSRTDARPTRSAYYSNSAPPLSARSTLSRRETTTKMLTCLTITAITTMTWLHRHLLLQVPPRLLFQPARSPSTTIMKSSTKKTDNFLLNFLKCPKSMLRFRIASYFSTLELLHLLSDL